jgi:acyl-CoA thioester hydrolase
MTAASSPSAGPVCPSPESWRQTIRFRVRYSETDQMGTFYNSRPLEWFEVGRTELLRQLGLAYSELESRGVFLPLIEARVEYLGRARYDDLLEMTTALGTEGRARLRTDVEVCHAGSRKGVVRGHTLHAFADREGRAVRPPPWWRQALAAAGPTASSMPDHLT